MAQQLLDGLGVRIETACDGTSSISTSIQRVETASVPDNIEYESITKCYTHIDTQDAKQVLHARIGWTELYVPVDVAQITFPEHEKNKEIPYVKERDQSVPTLEEWKIECARNRQTLAQRKKCGTKMWMCPYCKLRAWIGKKENCRIHIRGCKTPSRKQNPCPVMVELKAQAKARGEAFVEKAPVAV